MRFWGFLTIICAFCLLSYAQAGCSIDADCPVDGYLAQPVCAGQNLFNVYGDYSCQGGVCVFTERNDLAEHCKFSCYEGQCRIHPGTFQANDPTPDYPCPPNANMLDAKTKFDLIDASINSGRGYTTDAVLTSWKLGIDDALTLGWREGTLMAGYLEMYKATKDQYYLQKFIYNADVILSWRDDYYRDASRPYGIRDYGGNIGKTWSFRKQDSERLFVQYEQTTGLLSYPLADFAKIVYDDPALWDTALYDSRTMKQKADYYLVSAEESVATHNRGWFENGNEGYYKIFDPGSQSCSPGYDWVSCAEWMYKMNHVDEYEGYYVCPANTAPIPYERACVPINQQSILLQTIVRLYELTGKPEYLNKIQKFSQFLKNQLAYDAQNDLYTIRHQCGDLYTGWPYTSDRCPYQMFPNTGYEGITYFSIELDTAYMLYKANAGITETDMQRLARTFKENIYHESTNSVAESVSGQGEDVIQRLGAGYFLLSEFDPDIYSIASDFYRRKPSYYYSECHSMAGYARVISSCVNSGFNCGDGACVGIENCENCQADCGCQTGQYCCGGSCEAPACLTNADCTDSNPCTLDSCSSSGCDAVCAHPLILQCANGDGCCPLGCASFDSDCSGDCTDLDLDGYYGPGCGGNDCFDSLSSAYANNAVCSESSDPVFLEATNDPQGYNLIADHAWIKGDDGLWHMYMHWLNYNADIAHFTTTDFKSISYAGNVLQHGLGTYYGTLWSPYVIENGGTYYMFVTAVEMSGNPSIERIALATSTNLYNWQFYPTAGKCAGVAQAGCVYECDNAWTAWGGPNSFDSQCRDPTVIRDEANNRWVMFATARFSSGGSPTIDVSYSTNLVDWTGAGYIKAANKFPEGEGAQKTGGQSENPFVFEYGGNYYLFWTDWQDPEPPATVQYAVSGSLLADPGGSPNWIYKGSIPDMGVNAIEVFKPYPDTWLMTQSIAYDSSGDTGMHLRDLRVKRIVWNPDGTFATSKLTDLNCRLASSAIHLGATDICGNGIDEDCSGSDLACGCNEIWYCTSWNTCVGGTQARTCTDSNACGTQLRKPAEQQSCDSGGTTGGSSTGSSGGGGGSGSGGSGGGSSGGGGGGTPAPAQPTCPPEGGVCWDSSDCCAGSCVQGACGQSLAQGEYGSAYLRADESKNLNEKITVYLEGEDGKPLGNAIIYVVTPTSEVISVVTDSSGQASFTAEQVGEYQYYAPGYDLLSQFSTYVGAPRSLRNYCGDSTCAIGETCLSCPGDCGICAPRSGLGGSGWLIVVFASFLFFAVSVMSIGGYLYVKRMNKHKNLPARPEELRADI